MYLLTSNACCKLSVLTTRISNSFLLATFQKLEVRSAWNPSVSGIVLTKCFTCISVVFDLFCIKHFMFKHWQEFKYKMLAVTFHLADYVRCLSFETWWHCHQKKQHSDKFKEDSWGHHFTAIPPSQRPKIPNNAH